MSEEIRIYVADLAAYNSGILYGTWIDATLDVDDIQEQINKLLESSPIENAEEYAIHDYEGFGNYPLSEYEGINAAHELACFIEQHEEMAGELLSIFNGDIEQASKAIEENYCGCHKSVADYAEELTEGTSEIPEHLARYIDYSAMAHDMEIGGDIFTIETGFEEVHIFWNH